MTTTALAIVQFCALHASWHAMVDAADRALTLAAVSAMYAVAGIALIAAS